MSGKVGRPRLSSETVALVLELARSGMGYGTIADKLAIGKTSVQRIIRNSRALPSQNRPEGDG